jgi:DNA-binding MarR family transcriptional regulator
VSTTDDLRLRLGLLLRRAHAHAAAQLNDALQPQQLTGRHFGVLTVLDAVGTASQRDLIRRLGSDKAGMVRTVDDLERLGYLSRTTSPLDRRVSDLALTEAGRSSFARARENAQQRATHLFAALSEDEQEVLAELLARIVPSPPGTP